MVTCKFIVVRCMDLRLHRTINNIIESVVKDEQYDLLSVAGGAANHVQLKEHLGLSKRLHESTHALLTIHEDCGAGATVEDLEKAGQIAREMGFETTLCVIKLDGTWKTL